MYVGVYVCMYAGSMYVCMHLYIYIYIYKYMLEDVRNGSLILCCIFLPACSRLPAHACLIRLLALACLHSSAYAYLPAPSNALSRLQRGQIGQAPASMQ